MNFEAIFDFIGIFFILYIYTFDFMSHGLSTAPQQFMNKLKPIKVLLQNLG